VARHGQFDKTNRWQNALPVRNFEQATPVRTANWIGAMQHDQPELIGRCWSIHRFVYQQMDTVLPFGQCGASTIATEVGIERYYRRSIQADFG